MPSHKLREHLYLPDLINREKAHLITHLSANKDPLIRSRVLKQASNINYIKVLCKMRSK
jgi:hypothetical protein